MKLKFRTEDGVLTAEITGQWAVVALANLMSFVETAKAKDPSKKIFRFIKDAELPYDPTRLDGGLSLYFWKGSVLIVED